MTQQGIGSFEWLRKKIDRLVASCQSPAERRIGYGNLRQEYSTWQADGGEQTNIALIYEIPGGSTTQLNVTYCAHEQVFTYLNESGESVTTGDGKPVFEYILNHVQGIPAKRQAQLDSQVDTWMGQGNSSREVFGRLNKLLQDDFLGNRVTTTELKTAIQYAIKVKAQQEA